MGLSRNLAWQGAADGVGATIKATADRLVLYGTDITNSDELLDALKKQLNVKMFKIDPDRSDFFKRERDRKKIPAIHQCRETHQVLAQNSSIVVHRVLSCYCDDTSCDAKCFNPRKTTLDRGDLVQVLSDGEDNDDRYSSGSDPEDEEEEETAFDRVEKILSPEQRSLFRRRLDEGYDVDLSTVPLAHQLLHMKWTTWQALAPASMRINHERPNLQLHHFYAVLYWIQETKKVFYIDKIIKETPTTVTVKFLQRTTTGRYDWPKKPDVEEFNEEKKKWTKLRQTPTFRTESK